jgi:hypothetical protein
MQNLQHYVEIKKSFIACQLEFEGNEEKYRDYKYSECDIFNTSESLDQLCDTSDLNISMDEHKTIKSPTSKNQKTTCEKLYFCDLCPYFSAYKTKLKRHIERHIPKKYRNLFKCSHENCTFRK